MMTRFFSQNRHGFCLLGTCQQVPEDLEHLLIICPALEHTRMKLQSLWYSKTVDCQPLHQLIITILGSSPFNQTKFILDCTSFPEIVSLRQALGNDIQDRVLYLTRTWAQALHRQKLKILGRWPGSNQDMNNRIRDNQGLPDSLQIMQHQGPSHHTNDFIFTGDVTSTCANTTTSLSAPAPISSPAADTPSEMNPMSRSQLALSAE